jgi:cytochrome c-type biogenesis protein CcmH/NrfG
MKFYKKINSNFIAVTLIILTVLAVYLPSLKYDFTGLDDKILILDKAETLTDYSKIPSYFTKTVFDGKQNAYKFYRPVLIISFAVDALIMKQNPLIYHCTNILLHIFCGICLFIFLQMFGFDKTLSLLCALIFVNHPAFSHAVSWVPGRNDMLLALFGAVSCIFLMRYAGSRKALNLILFALSYALVLFTKETAVVMFIIYFMILYVFSRGGINKNLAVKIFSISFAVTILYFLLRHIALRNTPFDETAAVSLAELIKSVPSVIKYVEYCLIPSNLNIFLPAITISYVTLAALALFCVFMTLAFYLKNTRKHVVVLGILWFFMLLAPTLVLPNNYYYVHRLYFAAWGAIIVFAEVAAALIKKYPVIKKYLYSALIFLIIIFGIFARLNSVKFENEDIFWAYAVSETPASSMVRRSLALRFMQADDLKNAEEEILKAIRLNPENSGGYLILGRLYGVKGKFEQAENNFLTALEYNQANAAAYYYLAMLHSIKDDNSQALQNIEKALNIAPRNKEYQKLFNEIKQQNNMLK